MARSQADHRDLDLRIDLHAAPRQSQPAHRNGALQRRVIVEAHRLGNSHSGQARAARDRVWTNVLFRRKVQVSGKVAQQSSRERVQSRSGHCLVPCPARHHGHSLRSDLVDVTKRNQRPRTMRQR